MRKLTDLQRQEIRDLVGKELPKVTANKYGISCNHVRNLQKYTDGQLLEKSRSYCPHKSRKSYVKYKYNLDPDLYEKMLKDQGNRCCICKRSFLDLKRNPHVDHCHDTNKIRGILCHYCNVGIANLGEDVSTLQMAIKYLEDSRGK